VQAQELMAHLDDLSFKQKRLLATLGDAGFEALLPLLTEHVARSQRKGEPSNRLNKALEALRLVMQPRHTEAVLALLKSTQGAQTPDERGTRAILFYFLAGERSGWLPSVPDNCTDPALLVPLFLAECQKGPTSDGYSSALGYLTRSTHPDALAFLKPQLTNPSATKALRRAAYLNLARTGGAAFVPALLAARDTRRTVPALTSRLDLDKRAPTVLPEEKTRYETTRVLALARDT
jgi:hypothetical protein